MEIRKLNTDDKTQLFNLIKVIETNLPDNTWWLPIKEKAKEEFFNENWTIFVGAFENNILIGASALFLNEYEFGEAASYLEDNSKQIFAEIGRCMVHPNYRGKNILYLLNDNLIKEAKKLNKTHLIATAHPNNIPSNTSLQKSGFKIVKTIVKDKIYPRNILLLDLKEV